MQCFSFSTQHDYELTRLRRATTSSHCFFCGTRSEKLKDDSTLSRGEFLYTLHRPWLVEIRSVLTLLLPYQNGGRSPAKKLRKLLSFWPRTPMAVRFLLAFAFIAVFSTPVACLIAFMAPLAAFIDFIVFMAPLAAFIAFAPLPPPSVASTSSMRPRFVSVGFTQSLSSFFSPRAFPSSSAVCFPPSSLRPMRSPDPAGDSLSFCRALVKIYGNVVFLCRRRRKKLAPLQFVHSLFILQRLLEPRIMNNVLHFWELLGDCSAQGLVMGIAARGWP